MEAASSTRAPLKVAIVGKAPASLGLAPYHDPAWEIWTLSDLIVQKQVPRWTRHFEVHQHADIRNRGGGTYWKWMQELPADGNPVYMPEPPADIPAARKFPVEELVAKFGHYFTNTVSWMLAFALHEGAEEIGVWGVDMACSEEYKAQRPSCEYFIGLAVGAGVAVTMPGASDLLKCRKLYGVEPDEEFSQKFKARTAELSKRVTDIETRRDNAALEAAYLKGALDSQAWYAEWLPIGD